MTGRALTVVTNSQLTCFRRCQREHYYSYLLGYRTHEKSDALRFGTLWHRALEQWWLGRGLPAAIEAGTTGAVDGYEAARVRALLRGYDARWSHETYGDVIGVEREFYAPLINPVTGGASRTFVLGGKLDVLLRDRFIEHKTTSEDLGLGSTYWRRLTLDPQVSTYYAGARALGNEVHGCIYDVARKPAQRPLARGETPEEYEARIAADIANRPEHYYQRGEIVRLEEDEHEAALDAWNLTQAMKAGERLKQWPKNPEACIRYGRVCPYLDVCCRITSIEDPRYQRVENVHPELSCQPQQSNPTPPE